MRTVPRENRQGRGSARAQWSKYSTYRESLPGRRLLRHPQQQALRTLSSEPPLRPSPTLRPRPIYTYTVFLPTKWVAGALPRCYLAILTPVVRPSQFCRSITWVRVMASRPCGHSLTSITQCSPYVSSTDSTACTHEGEGSTPCGPSAEFYIQVVTKYLQYIRRSTWKTSALTKPTLDR